MSFSRTTNRGGPALSVIVSAAMLTAGGALEVSLAAATAPLNGRVVHVNDSDSSWAEQAYECVDGGADLTPRQTMVLGPQRAPFGSGSHRMVVGESTVQTELYRTNLYDGTRLDEITRLAYSTYARPRNAGGADRQLPYLRINVDNNGDNARDQSLFFIPANNPDQELVGNGTWQHWNVRSGVIGVNGDPGEGPTTIDKYLVANPDSTLVNNDEGKSTGGAIALIVGCNDRACNSSRLTCLLADVDDHRLAVDI